jgi:hypothetical protein
MAKDPADRFPDALTMQMALEACLVKQNAVSNAFLIGQYLTELFHDVVAAQKRHSTEHQTITVEGIISGIEESRKSEPEYAPESTAEVPTTPDLLAPLQELPTGQKPPGPGSRRKVVMTVAGCCLAVLLLVIVLWPRDDSTAETAAKEPAVTPGEVVQENPGRTRDAGSDEEDPEKWVEPRPPEPVSNQRTVETAAKQPAATPGEVVLENQGRTQDAGSGEEDTEKRVESRPVSDPRIPAPTRRRSNRKIPGASREPGYLTIDSRPWSEVWLRDEKLGMTPLAVRKLPSGRYKLKLVNRKQGLKKTVPVRIRPGKTTTIMVHLRKE